MKTLKKLTECEQRVMMAIWKMEKDGQDVTMQSITETVNAHQDRQWKTQTVSTFLARMVKKDYLSMERKGRTFVYTPLVDKDAYSDMAIPTFFKIFGLNKDNLPKILRYARIDPENIPEILKLLGVTREHLEAILSSWN